MYIIGVFLLVFGGSFYWLQLSEISQKFALTKRVDADYFPKVDMLIVYIVFAGSLSVFGDFIMHYEKYDKLLLDKNFGMASFFLFVFFVDFILSICVYKNLKSRTYTDIGVVVGFEYVPVFKFHVRYYGLIQLALAIGLGYALDIF